MIGKTRWIELALIVMSIVGASAILLANPDPLVRDWLCRLNVCWPSDHAVFWNTLFYDIGIGVLMSTVFYWLLVKVPERSKRSRLRRHLQVSYRSFRREVTTQLFFAAHDNRSVAYDDVLKYSSMPEFRNYFKGASDKVAGNRWHDVANGMTDSIRQDLAVALTLLRDDISYVLNVMDLADDESFELLFGLQRSASLVLLDPTEGDQDNNLLGLLWQLMAGWNWIDGYPKDANDDRVQRLIDSI